MDRRAGPEAHDGLFSLTEKKRRSVLDFYPTPGQNNLTKRTTLGNFLAEIPIMFEATIKKSESGTYTVTITWEGGVAYYKSGIRSFGHAARVIARWEEQETTQATVAAIVSKHVNEAVKQ